MKPHPKARLCSISSPFLRGTAAVTCLVMSIVSTSPAGPGFPGPHPSQSSKADAGRRHEPDESKLWFSKNFSQNIELRTRLRFASRALDDWMKDIEEYGTLTMSSPLLADPAKGNFSFDLARTADQYFEGAQNIEGRATSQVNIANRFSAALSGQFDPTVAEAFEFKQRNFLDQQQEFELDRARFLSDKERAVVEAAAQRARANYRDRLKDDGAQAVYQAKLEAATKITDPVARAQKVREAKDEYAAALSTPAVSAAPTAPTAPSAPVADATDANVPSLPTSGFLKTPDTMAKEVADMIAGQGVNPFDDADLKLPDRAAIIESAGNRAVQALFNFLGKPHEAMPFADKTVLFAVVTVGVNPGWRTRKDFAGEITTRASFRYEKARREVVIQLAENGMLGDNASAQTICSNHHILASEVKWPKEAAAVREAQEALKEAKQEKKEAEDKLKIKADELQAEEFKTMNWKVEPRAIAPNDAPSLDIAVTNKALQHLASPMGDLSQKMTRAVGDLNNAIKSGQAGTQAKNVIEKLSGPWLAYVKDIERAYKEIKAEVDEKASSVEERNRALESVKQSTKTASLPTHSGSLDVFDRDPAPLVAGVSPLMETQALDVADSYRRQDAIALSLSVALRKAGVKGAGEIFQQYVKERQKNARTRSNNGVVNTFSASGGLFGFQVGPRLKGLEDPASRKGGSANVLDRQSFPAMLIIGFDRSDVRPQLYIESGKTYVIEPSLQLAQTTRWTPLSRKLFSFSSNDWWRFDDFHNPRQTEMERVEDQLKIIDRLRTLRAWLRDELNGARVTLANGGKPVTDRAKLDGSHQYTGLLQSLVDRADALETLASGSRSVQYLPKDLLLPAAAEVPKAGYASLSKISPAKVKFDNTTASELDFYLEGKGLKKVTLSDVTAAGSVSLTPIGLSVLSEKAILVKTQVPAGSKGGSVSFSVAVKAADLNLPGSDIVLVNSPLITLEPFATPAPSELKEVVRITKSGEQQLLEVNRAQADPPLLDILRLMQQSGEENRVIVEPSKLDLQLKPK